MNLLLQIFVGAQKSGARIGSSKLSLPLTHYVCVCSVVADGGSAKKLMS